MVACPVLRATVPATSANLGPGYDTLGLALNLLLEVRLTLSESDGLHYRGAGTVPTGGQNLVHRGFHAVHQRLGVTAPTATFEVDNPIPLARGLGSSSAALVAGAALANELLGSPLDRHAVLNVAAAIEGHPDNVAPAVFGGFTVSAASGSGDHQTAAFPVPATWRLLFGVPDFELATATARQVVPTSVTLSDVVLTTSRAALWVAAVAQDRPELLRSASLDVLHQPYRAALVPGFLEAARRARELGAYAVFLSGAGPTVGLVCSSDSAAACRDVLATFAGPGGQVLDLQPATGYAVTRC